MRSAAENFAEEGYGVLVPDLFWRQQPGVEPGYTPEDWNRASELAQGFDEARGVVDVQAAITALRALPELEGGVGVVGYCLGGKLATLAPTSTHCGMAVRHYCGGIKQKHSEANNIYLPLLLHFTD